MNILLGLLIPFAGTSAGAACVFFMRNKLSLFVKKALLGFASGVMVAASVAADSRDGHVRVDGKVCFCTGCRRFYDRHFIFACHGQSDPTSAYGCVFAGRSEDLAKKNNDACPCSDAA